jgi:hypothetical protein
MFERTNGDSNPFRRGATLALALLLLIAQSVAAAHYHQKDFRDRYTQSVQSDDGLCSLCLFHLNARGNLGAAPSTAAPAVAVWRLTRRARVRLHAAAVALLFSRAPPTAAV